MISWCALFNQEATYDELGLPRLHRAYFGISHEFFEEVLSVQSLDNIDQVDRNGRTLLCWVAKIGDYETVSKLLRCGANPNCVDYWGFSPLHRSLQPTTSIISATVLLAANADINARSGKGHSALSIAAGQKDGNSGMTILLMFGADPECEDSKGRTPIFQAARNNKVKNIVYLVKAGANIGHVSAIGLTVIDEAIRTNSHEALKFLVPYTFPGKHGMIPIGEDTLYYAAVWGDIETLEILAHGFWACIDVDSVIHGHAAIGHAWFRNNANKEWSEQHRRPPEPVTLRGEWFIAFGRFLNTIVERQRQSIDEASDNGEDEELWEDARERMEEKLLPEAPHVSQQSQAMDRNCDIPRKSGTFRNNIIFTNYSIPRGHAISQDSRNYAVPRNYGISRNYGSWRPFNCFSTCSKLSGRVSMAFTANKIEGSLFAVASSRFDQLFPYVPRKFSGSSAFRLSAASAVKEFRKGLTRIIRTLIFSDPPLVDGKQRVRWQCAVRR